MQKQRKRRNSSNDDEKRVRNGDRPFTKAKRSSCDMLDQKELQTYASLEKMLHKAIHAVRQLKKKGNTNTSPAPKLQSNLSSLSNSDLKTNVLSSDKSKAVKPTSKALSTRCFKCHRVGHYANKCQKQKSLVTLEKVETEPEKEDLLPIFDDYKHEPKEGSGGEQNRGHQEGSSSIQESDQTQGEQCIDYYSCAYTPFPFNVPDLRTNLFEEGEYDRTKIEHRSFLFMDTNQGGNLVNQLDPTEVLPSARADLTVQTDCAFHCIDPWTSGVKARMDQPSFVQPQNQQVRMNLDSSRRVFFDQSSSNSPTLTRLHQFPHFDSFITF